MLYLGLVYVLTQSSQTFHELHFKLSHIKEFYPKETSTALVAKCLFLRVLSIIFKSKVASSECSRDQPDIVDEFHLDTEEECITICQTFAAVPDIGCAFAAWDASGVSGGMCTLYKETFAMYIGHCQLLSGPPDTAGCSVDDPEENSCHGIRFSTKLLQIVL